MKKLFCILYLLMLNFTTQATVVVILRNNKEIIVGAESRRTKLTAQLQPNGFDNDWCKIRQAGKFFYTLGGANDVLQMAHAKHSSEVTKTASEFALDFGRNLSSDYNRYLSELKRKDPKHFYADFYRNNKFAEVAIFKIENGSPQLYILTFYNQSEVNQTANVAYRLEHNPEFRILGYSSDYFHMPINQRMQMESQKDTNPYSFIQDVIRYEEKFHPVIIGGPIDILKLFGNGKIEDNRKKTC